MMNNNCYQYKYQHEFIIVNQPLDLILSSNCILLSLPSENISWTGSIVVYCRETSNIGICTPIQPQHVIKGSSDDQLKNNTNHNKT